MCCLPQLLIKLILWDLKKFALDNILAEFISEIETSDSKLQAKPLFYKQFQPK
jgi:hypothetical protein